MIIDRQFYESTAITFRNHYFQDRAIISFLSSQNSIGCKTMEFVCCCSFCLFFFLSYKHKAQKTQNRGANKML